MFTVYVKYVFDSFSGLNVIIEKVKLMSAFHNITATLLINSQFLL